MKILCLDQSMQKTGYCISNGCDILSSGVLINEMYSKEPNRIVRLIDMSQLIRKELISKEKIEYVFIEGVQLRRNADTFMQLARLQGLILGVCSDLGIGCYVVQPSEWKSLLQIKGKKSAEQKENTIKTIQKLYSDVFKGSEDEADAIGIFHWVKNNCDI